MATGEYLICFSEKCNKEEVKEYFIECISRSRFSVTREEFEGKTLLTISAPFQLLAQKVVYVCKFRWSYFYGALMGLFVVLCECIM